MTVGTAVGDAVGPREGTAVGDAVGPREGTNDGDAVVGVWVETADGVSVGSAVGKKKQDPAPLSEVCPLGQRTQRWAVEALEYCPGSHVIVQLELPALLLVPSKHAV